MRTSINTSTIYSNETKTARARNCSSVADQMANLAVAMAEFACNHVESAKELTVKSEAFTAEDIQKGTHERDMIVNVSGEDLDWLLTDQEVGVEYYLRSNENWLRLEAQLQNGWLAEDYKFSVCETRLDSSFRLAVTVVAELPTKDSFLRHFYFDMPHRPSWPKEAPQKGWSREKYMEWKKLQDSAEDYSNTTMWRTMMKNFKL